MNEFISNWTVCAMVGLCKDNMKEIISILFAKEKYFQPTTLKKTLGCYGIIIGEKKQYHHHTTTTPPPLPHHPGSHYISGSFRQPRKLNFGMQH